MNALPSQYLLSEDLRTETSTLFKPDKASAAVPANTVVLPEPIAVVEGPIRVTLEAGAVMSAVGTTLSTTTLNVPLLVILV